MDGLDVGLEEGVGVGEAVRIADCEGVGVEVGEEVGAGEGLEVGADVGEDEGVVEGLGVSAGVGEDEGVGEGPEVGAGVDEDKGVGEGLEVGAGVAKDVGVLVGHSTALQTDNCSRGFGHAVPEPDCGVVTILVRDFSPPSQLNEQLVQTDHSFAIQFTVGSGTAVGA